MAPFRRYLRSASIAAGLALLLSGCVGPPAPPPQDGGQESPTPPVETNGNGGGGNGGGGGTTVEYEWGLPPSDTSVTGNDGPAYAALQRSCQEGQDYLDSLADQQSYGFRSPRNVVLFAAAIRICFGDLTEGQRLFQHAESFYGLEGLAPEGRAECDLYKSVRSVLEQRPRDDFPCPGGAAPEDRRGEDGRVDDPLTFDVDESLTPETETPVPTETPTEPPSGTRTEPPSETESPPPGESSE